MLTSRVLQLLVFVQHPYPLHAQYWFTFSRPRNKQLCGVHSLEMLPLELERSFCWFVFWCTIGLVQLVLALEFSDITDSVGLGLSSGTVGALADFNGDKLTDLLVLNKTGKYWYAVENLLLVGP